MIGAVRAHVDDKKELNMAYLPNLLGVVGGRCMTVKHTETHTYTHIYTHRHTHTHRAAPHSPSTCFPRQASADFYH